MAGTYTKAQNHTGTKWYRGGTEVAQRTGQVPMHKYLCKCLDIPIYEKHKITQVPKGTEVAHRWHEENGGYPWVPIHRYPYRYHLHTCHMTWHREHGRYPYVPIHRYLYRYL